MKDQSSQQKAEPSPYLYLYPGPLRRGILLRRYKRFLADVRLAAAAGEPAVEVETVHCANSGSMKACAPAGAEVVVRDAQNPKRKLRYTWEMVRIGAGWVGVHSALANTIVAGAISAGEISELGGYAELQRETTWQDSRFDLCLRHPDRPPCVVEIKHATMLVDGGRAAAGREVAEPGEAGATGAVVAFPDAVSVRARKHVVALQRLKQAGHRAVLFFSVGRTDVTALRPADEIDPEYGVALRAAHAAGVEIYAYTLVFSPEGVALGSRLPVLL